MPRHELHGATRLPEGSREITAGGTSLGDVILYQKEQMSIVGHVSGYQSPSNYPWVNLLILEDWQWHRLKKMTPVTLIAQGARAKMPEILAWLERTRKEAGLIDRKDKAKEQARQNGDKEIPKGDVATFLDDSEDDGDEEFEDF